MFRKLTVALAAPLLLTTACASESDGDALRVETGAAAVEALRAAPEAVADAGTATFEMTMTMTGLPGSDAPIEVGASGAYDADAGRMRMEMDMAAILGLAEDSDAPVPPGLDEPMQMIVDGTTIYVQMPMFDVLTGTAGWLSMTPEDLGQSAGSLGLGTMDPSQMLEVLRGTSDDVEAAGQEDVRGVPTTKYTAKVRMSDALEQMPEGQRDQLEAQLRQLGVDDAALPVEVWVDGDGLPRRYTMGFDGVLSAAGLDEGSMTMTMELFDYGEPVSIDVPSADDVTAFTDVMGIFGGEDA